MSPERRYNEQEIAAIFKQASADQESAQRRLSPSEGLTLAELKEIGKEAGLRYVYAGNLPGRVGEYEDTFCVKCNHRLIKRRGYVILEHNVTGDGRCPKCKPGRRSRTYSTTKSRLAVK